LLKGSKLLIHGFDPIRVFASNTKRRRLDSRIDVVKKRRIRRIESKCSGRKKRHTCILRGNRIKITGLDRAYKIMEPSRFMDNPRAMSNRFHMGWRRNWLSINQDRHLLNQGKVKG